MVALKRKKTGVLSVVEPGTLVWVPDTETGQVWVKAEVEIIDLDTRTVRVKTDDGSERAANLDKLLRCNTDTWKAEDGLTAVNDLSNLTHLHEPEVLQALQLRFDIDKIYTFCGPILIVLNPFKLIKGMYESVQSWDPTDNVTPHIFSIANRAFTNLSKKLQPQVCLISGESGAGKTESTKHVLKFLTNSLSHDEQASSDNTMKKVLSSNPLLEAFGNACTTRNDNSSRFGKFINLQFSNSAGKIRFECAAVETYLLEKIRITELQKQERSYHIFYQACSASQRCGASHLGLPLDLFSSITSFEYLKKSGRYDLDNVDDAATLTETKQAMDAMDISGEEQCSIIKMVASVLHVGNIPMKDKGSTTEIDTSGSSFQLVSKVLDIPPEQLAKAFTYRLISVSQTEKYDTPLTVSQSESLRESFARAIYSLLFNYIVHRVNLSLAGSTNPGVAKPLFCGVLDIFGFEHFEKNSFEQLCINFANERLQQLFNQFVFKTEMEIYQKEGVTCDFSGFPDNQDIIDMIQEKKCSIFTLLDEECRLPKGTDNAYCQKLWKTFDKNPRFKVEPRKPTCFSVVHFAGTVSYSTAHFMEKNMDELGELLKQALEASKDPLVMSILELKQQKDAAQAASAPAKPGGRGGKLKPNTTSADFKGQMESLMTKMASAFPHFVRCIKPNPEKRADRYNRQSVAEQLRSGGVIEALCVQRAGFPCRWAHKECWDNIRIMFKMAQRKQFQAMDIEKRVQEALTQLAKELKWPAAAGTCYAIGQTKVFFKQSPFEALESARISVLNEAAIKLQSCWKRYCFRRIYVIIHNTLCYLQAFIRRYLQRKRVWDSMKPAQRRRSMLFRTYFKMQKLNNTLDTIEDSDGSEICDLANKEDTARFAEIYSTKPKEPVKEQKEQQQLHEEEMLEEKLRLQQEAQEAAAADLRRVEEERRQAEEGRLRAEDARAGAEKECQKLQEERREAERQWQEERVSADTEHAHEVRRLEVELKSAKEDVGKIRRQCESELQLQRREAEVRAAEFEQKSALMQLQNQQANSRVEELERENKRLREDMAAQAERHMTATGELQSAHAAALAHAAEQHEAQRAAYIEQIDTMREGLDEAHRLQQEAIRAQENEHAQRFRDEVKHLRDRETTQHQRHEEELAKLHQKELERQRKWQAKLQETQRNESDHRLQIQVMEQQLQDLRADNEQHRKLLEAQQQETTRMHTNQIQMLEQQHSEREQALEKELEITTTQRNEQVAALRGQLQFQKRELIMTCQQEVEMMKHQWEQRERQLMQMLNQARLGQAEREKTAEVQLALKAQQQDELHRCADAKARHLEESARRQQELYEQHVEQLTRQMRDSQEGFRRQLEEAQAQNDERLAVSVEQLATLEAQIREDQERRRAQEEAEREDIAWKMAETAKLNEKVKQLEYDNEALQKEVANAKAADSTRARGSTMTRASIAAEPSMTRRRTEPVPKLAEGGERKFKAPMRLLLGPKRLSMVSTQSINSKETSVGPLSSQRSSVESRATFKDMPATRQRGSMRGSIIDLLQGSSRSNTTRSTLVKPAAKETLGLLRPTLEAGGMPQLGQVSAWREIAATQASLAGRQADSAITILTFAESKADANCWLLAAANKSGNLSVYKIRRTALELEDPEADAASNGVPDVEVKVQFMAHAKAITSMSFSMEGKELMTTSSDWHVRIWQVEDGSLKNRFVDSSLVVCALPIPGQVWSIVMANAGAVLRLISTESDQKQQKVRLDHYARSLALTLDGTRLLAGTSRGHIHALDVDETGLRIVGKQQVSSQAALTCLVVAPCADGMPPLVVANVMDNTVCVLQANTAMTNFTVLKRLPNPHKLLPLRCCHIPHIGDGDDGEEEGGAGFIASASEDGTVHVVDLDGFQEMKLTGHGIAVVDVAATSNCGLLASGDVHGRIILWRRGAQGPNGLRVN